jgi:hypothetical protein
MGSPTDCLSAEARAFGYEYYDELGLTIFGARGAFEGVYYHIHIFAFCQWSTLPGWYAEVRGVSSRRWY